MKRRLKRDITEIEELLVELFWTVQVSKQNFKKLNGGPLGDSKK